MSNDRNPRGLRNNNPLNIRINPRNNWQGKVAHNTDGAFEQFETLSDGCRAACKLILYYYLHLKLNTIALIVSRWAPPTENNTSAYIRSVCKRTGFAGEEKLTPNMLFPVIYAMACVEIGEIHAITIHDALKKAFQMCIYQRKQQTLSGSNPPVLHQRQN